MKSILLIFLTLFCGQIFCYTKIEKLSTSQAISILELIDDIKYSNNNDLKMRFKELTDYEYEDKDISMIKIKLYNVIHQNVNYTSFFMKMAGLVTLKNIISILMVIVGIAFLFSFLGDLILILGNYLGLFLWNLLVNKKVFYSLGYLLSSITLYYKYDQIESQLLKYLFIFDQMTPLFGCILFGILSFKINDDFINYLNKIIKKKINYQEYSNQSNPIIGIFVTLIWGLMAIYHDNWIIGVITIIMLFFTCGFMFGSMSMGYYITFNNDNSIERCFFISVILNLIFIALQIKFVEGNISLYASVFQTGVYFWGTLVGSFALLIMSDETYLYLKQAYNIKFFIMQVVMSLYCFSLMYFGNILYISAFKNIGGTFLVLWGLNLEKTILRKFNTGVKTIMLFVILSNLYVIKYLITTYPEYSLI